MRRRSRHPARSAMARYCALTLWAVVAIFPIFWIVATSFKPDTQWFAWPPVYFPHPPTLANYLKSGVAGEGERLEVVRRRETNNPLY